jgi:hypothetical protein
MRDSADHRDGLAGQRDPKNAELLNRIVVSFSFRESWIVPKNADVTGRSICAMLLAAACGGRSNGKT